MDRKTLKHKPVYVRWQDAESHDPWEDFSFHKETPLPVVHTLGFILHETKDYILLSGNVDPLNEKVSQTMKIPKSMIVSKKLIKLI